MRIFATVAAAALLGCSSLASAQEEAPIAPQMADSIRPGAAECLCVLREVAGPQIGAVGDVQGQVLLADGGGYTPIRSNVEISVGDRLVLLENGRAVLVAGPDCRLALAPRSMISIVPIEGGVCVARALTGPHVGAAVVGGMFAAGVTATAIAAIAAALDDDDPVSP